MNLFRFRPKVESATDKVPAIELQESEITGNLNAISDKIPGYIELSQFNSTAAKAAKLEEIKTRLGSITDITGKGNGDLKRFAKLSLARLSREHPKTPEDLKALLAETIKSI